MEIETENSCPREEAWLTIHPDLNYGSSAATLPEWRIRRWSLVLASRSIPYHTEYNVDGWQLLVPADHFDAACNELRLFERENRNWPPPPPQSRPLIENTLSTLSVLLLLATFHNLTLLELPLWGNQPVNWIALGNASSARIATGEWWRIVTALTLHSDWVHLLSNLTIGGVFIVALGRELGSGLAWTLLLCSGMLGNLANAHMQRLAHSSIGSSTLVFGAVGILAALSLFRHRYQLRRRWPLPIAAALALLAVLGTEGKNTDLGAHLFGFIFGTVLGLAAGFPLARYGRPGPRLNIVLALASAASVLGAWWLALARS